MSRSLADSAPRAHVRSAFAVAALGVAVAALGMVALALASCRNEAPLPRAEADPTHADDVRFVFAPSTHPENGIQVRYAKHALARWEASTDASTTPYAQSTDGRAIELVTAHHLLMVTVSGERLEIDGDDIRLDGAALASWPQALVVTQQGAVEIAGSW